MLERIKSNDAFMGETHSASSIALYLIFWAIAPSLLISLLATESIIVIILSIFVLFGASRLPDLDNSRSSAMSALGPLGHLLSEGMRALSVSIFYLTRSDYDDENANPHRGFFHTAVSGILLFFLILSTCSITLKIGNVQIGQMFAILWIFMCSQIALSSIASKFYKKNKKDNVIIGTLINFIISFFMSLLIVIVSQTRTENYQWLAFVISFGCITHILGDLMTVSGAPFLFPLKIKGKRWYNIRIAKFKAGNDFEKKIILPTFIGISLLALVRIILYLN